MSLQDAKDIKNGLVDCLKRAGAPLSEDQELMLRGYLEVAIQYQRRDAYNEGIRAAAKLAFSQHSGALSERILRMKR